MRGLRTILCLLSILVGQSLATNETEAKQDAVYAGPPLEYSVRDATIVARVRIVGETRQYLGLQAPGMNKQVCGYVLTAVTTASFRGRVKQFKFFASTNSGFAGIDRDYFAIVFSRDIPSSNQDVATGALSESQELKGDSWINCALANKNYVSGRYQTLWSFDGDAQKRWGGEWLLAASGSDGLFCGYNASEVYPRGAEIKIWAPGDNRRYYFVKWSDIEHQVLAFSRHTASGDFGMCARAPPIPGFRE
jgi:hypothetical protein